MSEVISIKAHYDGENIVPDEPLKLRKGTAIIINIKEAPIDGISSACAPTDKFQTSEERLERFQQMVKAFEKLPPLPDIPMESLSRENLYADDRY